MGFKRLGESGLQGFSSLGSPKGKPFSPLDLSPIAWFDFSDISTLYQDSAKTTRVTADSDPIGAVVDKSNNGNDALQNVNGERPLYIAASQNGRSIARFDSINDKLETAASLISGSSERTIIFATNPSNAVAGNFFASDGSVSNGLVGFLNTIRVSAFNAGGGNRVFDAAAGTDPVILTYSQSGTNVTGYRAFKNSTELGVSSETAIEISVGTGIFVLNAAFNDPGFVGILGQDLFEVLYFNYLLSETQCQKVENYLNEKWAIF